MEATPLESEDDNMEEMDAGPWSMEDCRFYSKRSETKFPLS